MHILLLLVAKHLYLIVGVSAFIYWLTVSRQEKIRLVVFGVIAATVTFLSVKLGAMLFYDPRPFVTHHVTPLYPHAADNGFPSDHTVLAAFIALSIFSSSRRTGVILLVMAIFIGIARVIGHIHSPVDIVGSLVFALVGFGIAEWVTSPLLKKIKARREHISSD